MQESKNVVADEGIIYLRMQEDFQTRFAFVLKQQLKLHLIMIEINTLVLTYTSAGRQGQMKKIQMAVLKTWAQSVVLTKL